MSDPDYPQIVNDYCQSVLKGKVVVGRYERLAVERHFHDLKNASERGFYFDQTVAVDAIEFYPLVCTHSTGEWSGLPFDLAPWQCFVVWVLFGWQRYQECGACFGVGCTRCERRGFLPGVVSRNRRFRRGYICLARKNGKTAWAAATGLKMLAFDHPHEQRAEVYVAATMKEQAYVTHDEATRMVKVNEQLNEIVQVHTHNLSCPHNFAKFVPLGSNSKNMDALNPHCVIKDELHAWTQRHRGLHEKLSSGGAARKQPLELVITTAGDDKSEIWLEEHRYAQRCLDSVVSGNVVDDEQFSFVCQMEDGDDIYDETNWRKANPNLDVSVRRDYLRSQATEAREKPAARQKFIRYHCNMMTASAAKPITPELWAKGQGALSDWSACESFGGFDLGRTNDFAAIGLVNSREIEDDDGTYRIYEARIKAWTCRQNKWSGDINRHPYSAWVESGVLQVCDGDAIDPNEVLAAVVDWDKKYNCRSWDYDPNFATLVGLALVNDYGINAHPMYQTHKN